jgi:predicted GIY-YIG superfamily endonuclease
MKSFYVYKIIDKADNILYIGETSNLETRFKVHTSTQGLFYKRLDISLVIVKEFKTKKEAFEYQLELQTQYGFQTDLDKIIKSAQKGSSIRMQKYKEHGNWKREINCFEYKTKKFIAVFKSTREASRVMDVTNIDKVLNGTYKQVGGYYFEYK